MIVHAKLLPSLAMRAIKNSKGTPSQKERHILVNWSRGLPSVDLTALHSSIKVSKICSVIPILCSDAS